jgi:hypothetical protein
MKLLFCYLEHLNSLKLGHAKGLMSWVGLYILKLEIVKKCCKFHCCRSKGCWTVSQVLQKGEATVPVGGIMNKTLNTLCRFSSCVTVQGECASTFNGNISVQLIFSFVFCQRSGVVWRFVDVKN